jgi:hypothetical protein
VVERGSAIFVRGCHAFTMCVTIRVPGRDQWRQGHAGGGGRAGGWHRLNSRPPGDASGIASTYFLTCCGFACAPPFIDELDAGGIRGAAKGQRPELSFLPGRFSDFAACFRGNGPIQRLASATCGAAALVMRTPGCSPLLGPPQAPAIARHINRPHLQIVSSQAFREPEPAAARRLHLTFLACFREA